MAALLQGLSLPMLLATVGPPMDLKPLAIIKVHSPTCS